MNQGFLSENHSPEHPIDRSTITPRPYQVEALEATLQAYAQGQRRVLTRCLSLVRRPTP